jgi:hypothetical protein
MLIMDVVKPAPSLSDVLHVNIYRNSRKDKLTLYSAAGFLSKVVQFYTFRSIFSFWLM